MRLGGQVHASQQFEDYEENTKRIRNIITRLKIKLECDLFETIYSHGYSLKYRQI